MKRGPAALLVLLFLGSAGVLRADDPPPPPRLNSCQVYADQFCQNAAKDVVLACLVKSIDKIPLGSCKKRVQREKDSEDALIKGCQNDLAGCEGKDFTTGLVACLRSEKNLSEDCKAAMVINLEGGKGRHHRHGGQAAPAQTP